MGLCFQKQLSVQLCCANDKDRSNFSLFCRTYEAFFGPPDTKYVFAIGENSRRSVNPCGAARHKKK